MNNETTVYRRKTMKKIDIKMAKSNTIKLHKFTGSSTRKNQRAENW